MERTLGVEQARNQLGRLADEVNERSEVVVLTRRGRPVAILMGPADYERANEARRQVAREELARRVDRLRKAVAKAGLDRSLVDEAIAAARGRVTLRAVLDTNVLVSGLGWPGPPTTLLDAAFDGRIHLITSQPLLDELMWVLDYRRLAVVLTNSGMSASELVKSIAASSMVVAPNRRVTRAPDPEDNRVLEAAVTGDVDAVVTGDHDLLAPCKFEGVPIIGASEGVARLLHAT